MDKQSQIKSLTFICQTLGMGGAETVNTDLLRAVRAETDAEVFAYVNFAPLVDQLQKANIPTKKLPIVIDIIGNWKGFLKAVVLWPFALLQYLWVVCQVRHTDVILMSGFIEKIFVTPLAKIFSIPVVWIEFAPMEEVSRKFFGFPFLLYRFASYFPKYIIVPTVYTERYFLKDMSYLAKKIVVLPCGRYGMNSQQISERKIQKNSQNVVCVSRMEKGKGQDLLVQAFVKVMGHFPDAKLTFVGEGDFEKEVRAEVSRLKLSDAVEFTGRVANSLEVIQQATVCVFPSMWSLEGFGMVTIEAMAMAKPIVAFNRGPSPEILKHEETGLLAKAGDVEDLAQQIMKVLANPDLAKKLGKNAQKKFNDTYRFEKLIFQYLKIFQKATYV